MGEIHLVELKCDERKKADELAELARVIWIEHYTPIIGADQVEYMLARFQTADKILDDIASNGYQYFITYDGPSSAGSKLAGYFAIKPEYDKKALFLSKLYIEKSSRGCGISRMMLDKMLMIAREADLSYIWLNVNKHNSSVDIYKKLGFKVAEEIVTDIGDGYVMDDYRMRLEINNSSL